MFLRYARSSQPYVLIILSLMLGIMWFTVAGNSDYCKIPIISLFKWLENLSTSTALLSEILGYVSILIISSLIIQLNTKYLFIGQRSYLPGIIFVLISLMNHKAPNFHPIFLVAILFLFILDRLIATYRFDRLSYNPFDAAFLMGVCALFYPSAIFLIVFILFALLIFRPFFWREWAFVFIGLILPFYFTYAIIYLFNKPESANFLSSYIEILRYSCPSIHFSSVDRYVFYFVIFILLVSVMHVLSMMGNMKILARKSYYLFFILLLNLLAIYGLVPQAGKEISIMMAIPVSYLLSFYFNSGRLTRIKVIFFDILVLAIILAHYIH